MSATNVSDRHDQHTQEAQLLLDRYLPNFDFTRLEHVVADADVPSSWQALLALDLLDVHTPVIDAAFWVRGIPPRVAAILGKAQPPSPPPLSLRLGDDTDLEGWVGLGKIAERELAFGAIGRFWEANITWHDVATPDEYLGFDEQGWGRIAAGFSLQPYGQRTLLTYEARTLVPDENERRRFARYWALVSPFVGHIMRASLTAWRRDAERRYDGATVRPNR